MKRLIFKKLHLLSLRDKRAKEIEFDPRLTIIKGANECGKSALIKSIYRTLGAEPTKMTEKWENSDVVTALHFSIDQNDYIILRHSNRYSIFIPDEELVDSFSSVTKELSPFLAKLFAYKLQLAERNKRLEMQATPAFLYLPFYIDQDISWIKPWGSFERLKQFSFKKEDVVYYHTGVRPNEFYEFKKQLSEKETGLEPLNTKIAILNSILYDLEKKISHVTYDVNIEAYRQEIEQLLIKYNQIKKEEDRIKEELARAYSTECIIKSQIALTQKAINEISRDYKFITKEPEIISCPTCGAEYENNFKEQFAIAQDEDRCLELLSNLKISMEKTYGVIERIKADYTIENKRKCAIQEILNIKKGELTLKEIIEIEGKRELRVVLGRDIRKLEKELTYLVGEVERIKDKIKNLTDRKRSTKIKTYYKDLMDRFLCQLNVLTLPERERRKMTGNFGISGSDTPRAYLAYYYSVLHTIWNYTTSTFCPVVIDSPNQQDQDSLNWPTIMNFIKENTLPEWQLILGTVDISDVQFEGKTIEVTEKYNLLQKGEVYDKVSALIKPLIEKSLLN